MRFSVSAAAIVAILTLAFPAMAQQQPAPAARAQSANPGVPVTSPIVGRYASPSLYPATLSLTITGVDTAGNVTGAVSGMRNIGSPSGDQQRFSFREYRPFNYVFGVPRQADASDNVARATFNGSALTVLYGSGARLDLVYNNNELSGTLTDPNQPQRNKSVWFHRSTQ